MTQEDKQLYTRITKLMHEIGTPAHLRGHDYLRRAIFYAYNDHTYLYNLMDRLYPDLAVDFGTSKYGVERGIRSVIEAAFTRGSNAAINDVFGNTVDCLKAKPGNKEFIAMVVDELKTRSL